MVPANAPFYLLCWPALITGKWADIVAVDGDPLQDVTTLQSVKFVMKSGQVYKNNYMK